MELTSIKDIGDGGVTMVVTHPVSGVDTDIRITVMGKDSPAYQKMKRIIQNRRLQRPGKLKLDAEVIEAEGLELLVACVVGWENVQLEGHTLPCEPENVKRVFAACPWLRDQVDNFVDDRANFLQDSSRP